MLEQSQKEQLSKLFSELESDYVFDISVHQEHSARLNLIELLEDTASCSGKISCRIKEGEDLEFRLLKDGMDTGICFQAVPGGHEFTTLILAVLNADGKGKNMPDERLRKRIASLQNTAVITSYVSLTCTNCPDVVQALNIIALINPHICHTIVDGALHPEIVERLNIQAVPSVFIGEELFHVGRISFGELLDKLEGQLDTDQQDSSNLETFRYDALVAGGGPAGTSAAVYLARKGLQVAVVTDRIGGQVNETVGIENLISVPYTTGNTLANDLRKHMETYDIAIYDNRKIASFSLSGSDKVLRTTNREEFRASQVIIATGASWRKMNIPGEAEYIGKGVAFCPHCDGPFYRGKHVAIIGGGNSGVEAAIDLAGVCSHITILEFMENLKADTVLQDKLRNLPNVEIFTSRQTLEVKGNGHKVTGLRIKNRQTGEENLLDLDGVFVQIGLVPNSGLFWDVVQVNNAGEIITDKLARTSVPGVYAAGDVSDMAYKQIIISMGEGAKAALSAFTDRIKGLG